MTSDICELRHALEMLLDHEDVTDARAKARVALAKSAHSEGAPATALTAALAKARQEREHFRWLASEIGVVLNHRTDWNRIREEDLQKQLVDQQTNATAWRKHAVHHVTKRLTADALLAEVAQLASLSFDLRTRILAYLALP